MKREAAIPLSIAVASLVLFCPPMIRAENASGSQPSLSGNSATPMQNEASMMVPAKASLVNPLDSRKIHPGSQFEAVLSSTVHLKSGEELPRGTVLMGKVVTDQMKAQGVSKLALQFTQARLKSGKMVPIKATIMGIAPPDYGEYDYTAQDIVNWDGKTLQMDQVNALSGIDLHSGIARSNSGVFVSNTKDDVKLDRGSQLALAIAPQGSHQS